MIYDVAIVGAGVTGCAIARRLARQQLSVLLLEGANDVAMGSSKANSAIVHSGYDCKPGTLMARLNVAGNAMYEKMCQELHVHYKKIGTMTVAFEDEQLPLLTELFQRGLANGVPGICIRDGEWARKREPELSDQVKAVLWAPSGAITCPYQLTIALAENAVMNGVELRTNFKVTAIFDNGDGYDLTSARGDKASCRYLINAAGLYADDISRMAGGMDFTIQPRKGEYMLLDRKEGKRVSTVVFQTPSRMGKGVLVSPTVDGNLFIGPTSVDVGDKEDTSTTAAGTSALKDAGAISVPHVAYFQTITAFAGNRAHVEGYEDFIIRQDEKAPRLIQTAGICSPGLSSAPAIAEEVANILEAAGCTSEAKADFNPVRYKPKAFCEMNDEERAQAVKENPLYGRIICRCETVTEAEIVAAIHSPVPAKDLDGVKRRTRAGMGRCQAGFCSPRTMEILAREWDCDLNDVTKFGGDSWITCGRIGENRE